MVLCHAGVEFDEHIYTHLTWKAAHDNWLEDKPGHPNGQIPAWQPAGSDKRMGQSHAIVHFLGKKYGYHADTAEELFEIEWVIETANEFRGGKTVYCIFEEKELGADDVKEYKEALRSYLM